MTCYHCGNNCDPKHPIVFDDKHFCCQGCQTVYEILSTNKLDKYYTYEQTPGARPEEAGEKYHFLDNPQIVAKLLEFDEGNTQIVSLYIPHIHCSSCIWVLENLERLHEGVIHALVDFPKKTVRISYLKDKITLKELVILLSKIGYAPYISLDDYSQKKDKKGQKQLLYKLGVAGFAFGNIGLLSFPGFFEDNEFWFNRYKDFFRWLMFAFSLPVMFYAATDYFVSAYKGIRNRFLTIDIPLALGILTMFVRSTYDIISGRGQGFFDSLASLVFLLLIGKFFQQRTYSFLSFERDYKSYFPIGVTRIIGEQEESIQVYDIKEGDRLLIRNEELIPVDAVLIRGVGQIDYSFVTGESKWTEKNSGDKLFAGGRHKGAAIEIEATKTVSQSYLTQLWSQESFQKNKNEGIKTLTDRISQYFTFFVLLIAFLTLAFWLVYGTPTEAFNAFTAVLIIACPCALAVSAPFALGNMLRLLGKRRFYLKDTQTIEQMARIDTLIFDKTGTITQSNTQEITYEGQTMNAQQLSLLKSVLRNSNHPLSRQLYEYHKQVDIHPLDHYQELIGRGMQARWGGDSIKVGSAKFVTDKENKDETAVYVIINGQLMGKYTFKNPYREHIFTVFHELEAKGYTLALLSGDTEAEKAFLQAQLSDKVSLHFNQSPADKLHYIEQLQKEGKQVMMLGDGLNDAGALKQAQVGCAVAENSNTFSPACEAILQASEIEKLPHFLALSKKTMQVIKMSFVLSLLYNCIGTFFAVTGNLEPVVAAILMPISSISIVLFTTLMTNRLANKVMR